LAKKKPDPDEPIIIKKYANRRLYDTASSAYVTLDDLSAMVREGVEFVVRDAKSGEDITRNVLNQIIFEQENRGENLLPTAFLRQLIRFYGDQMQAVLPSYLELSMEAFARQQQEMQEQMTSAMGGAGAYRMFEEMTRRNMTLFQNAMSMFAPGKENGAAEPETGQDDDLKALREEMEALRARLDSLSRQDRG